MSPLGITAIALAGLWALGVATSTPGGFVHVPAVVAVALLLVEFVANRRVREPLRRAANKRGLDQ